jgi:hypothetical protein
VPSIAPAAMTVSVALTTTRRPSGASAVTLSSRPSGVKVKPVAVA